MKKAVKFCFRCIWTMIKFIFNPPHKVSKLARKALAAGIAGSIENDEHRECLRAKKTKQAIYDGIHMNANK